MRIAFALLSIIMPLCSALYEITIEFDRFETDVTVLGKFDGVRVRKFNRTTPVINGSYELTMDLDDSLQIGITCSRSALGNNQFQLLPMQLFPQPLCGFAKQYAPEYQSMWEGRSNFPHIPLEGLCPIPRGSYYVNDIALDSKYFPPVVPEGYYRCDLNVTHVANGELAHHSAFFAKLTKELMKV